MLETKAKVCVVIPTYNREGVVARAVASVLREPLRELEVAVVDDGSSDRTPEIVAQHRDPRLSFIRLERHTNGNVARNAGVAATSAPLVAFLDSDDEFLPGRLARLVAFFLENPEIGATLDEFSVVTHGKASPAGVHPGRPDAASLVGLLVGHAVPLTTSAICVRREALAAIGGFDEGLARQQDRDLLLRLSRTTRVALATGSDVVKHQSADSFSRDPANYVASLDALVARHPVFTEPANRDLLGYLLVRSIVASIGKGRLASARAEIAALGRMESVSMPFLAALARYPRGRRQRRAIAKALANRAA